MPSDPLAERPATATVTVAAGGHLASLAYAWEHPEDGPQDGLLVLGAGEEPGSVVGLWGDSWHQQPAARAISGAVIEERTEFECDYGGGWRWRIVVHAVRDSALTIRMDNVIPADQATAEMAAGPYVVMLMDLQPA